MQSLEHRLAWFERQLFGSKGERLKVLDDPRQLLLGTAGTLASEPASPVSPASPAKTSIAAHERRRPTRDVVPETGEAESLPFFDRSRVPVETIEVLPPEVATLAPAQYEVIGQKTSYRLAQRSGSYVVLEYVRPIVKPRVAASATTDAAALPTILCAPAPAGVLGTSRADVSFLAGLLVDKFAWHLPLYRQHQRLAAAGLDVSRAWLTQLTQSALALLEPIYAAQLESIRTGRVIAMDETPIKAGRTGHGTMKTAYFWPVYGEADEVCFPYRPSRSAEHVTALLGARPPPGTVLVTDGHAAYAKYARSTGVTHAQCWVHARREVFEAQAHDPERARVLLEHIAGLFAIEDRIRAQHLIGEAKCVFQRS